MNTENTEISAATPPNSPKKVLAGLWRTSRGANLDQFSSNNVHDRMLAALDAADTRNQKGKENAKKTLFKESSVRLISDAVKANNGDRNLYIDGILALIEQYDCGAACSIRNVSTAAATKKLSRNMLETHIMPLLFELGIIIKISEKSNQWQTAERIGKRQSKVAKKLHLMFDVSDERLELRRQQNKAADQARLLTLAKKQAAIAQKRKQTALVAVNAAEEAAKLVEKLPKDESTFAWVKGNLAPIIIIGLFGMVMLSGTISPENSAENSTQTMQKAAFSPPANDYRSDPIWGVPTAENESVEMDVTEGETE